MQMRYYPKAVYYKVKDGITSVVLDYGEHQTEHIIAAQQSVYLTSLRSWLFGWFTGALAGVGIAYYLFGVR